MTSAGYQGNASALRELANPAGTVEVVELQGTWRLRALAGMCAWWTAAIESALAATFLLPARLGLVRYRHAILLLFAWTTYLVASIETFGWMLMAIGVGQCEPELRRTRVLYVATGLLVLTYDSVRPLSLLRSLVQE